MVIYIYFYDKPQIIKFVSNLKLNIIILSFGKTN